MRYGKAAVILGLLMASAGAAPAAGLRPAIGNPLQAAEEQLSAHKYAVALRDVAKAEAVPGKTASETLTIDQVRAAIDATKGDSTAAANDYAGIIATGLLAPDQLGQMAAAEASMRYQSGDYAGVIATIQTYLPADPQYRPILLQSYEKLGNCAALTHAVTREAKPAENELQMVAYCDANAKDTAGYTAAMEMLLKDYPSTVYWNDVLSQLQAQPQFADNLALDFFRLKLAAGVPATEPEYMAQTETAAQAGLTNEAAHILAQGYSSGVLGTGPDADRQTRLKALVTTRAKAANTGAAQAAQVALAGKDYPTLFGIGFNEVDGGNAAGIGLMEQSIRSGGLTQVGQAKLEMGIAYRESGETANANAMFHAVQGGDGAAELARLWQDLP